MRDKSFEEYLSEQFWKQYNGLDDDSVEAEQDWLEGLEPDDFITYAECWYVVRFGISGYLGSNDTVTL